MRQLRVSLLCFRYVAIPTLLVTLITGVLLWQSGNPLFVVNLAWTKVFTTGLFVLFVYFFKSHEFYFFHNLGFSLPRILLSMVLPDFLLTILLYVIILSCV